jgi:transposase
MSCILKGKLSPFPYSILKGGNGMKLFIGLDVSLAKTAVCVISEHGKIMKETEVTSEPEALSAFAGTLPGTVAIIGTEPHQSLEEFRQY